MIVKQLLAFYCNKDPIRQTEHVGPTSSNSAGRNMLDPVGHLVERCWKSLIGPSSLPTSLGATCCIHLNMFDAVGRC